MRTQIVVALCALVVATPATARCWKPGETVSWYGEPQRLPSGGRFNPEAHTCASRFVPAGSLIKLVDRDTGAEAECTVNDYGPAAWTRCQVDVSPAVARRLRMVGRGVARATVVLLRWGPEKAKAGAS